MLAAHELGSDSEPLDVPAGGASGPEDQSESGALQSALDRALSDLERSIEAVRAAARELLVEQGRPPVSLGLLHLLEATVRQVREGGAPPPIDSRAQHVELAGPARKTHLAQDALWEVRKGLPPEATLVAIVDVVRYAHTIAEFAKPFAGAMLPLPPGYPPAPDKGKPTYLGLRVAVRPERGEFDLYLPAGTVKQFYDTFVKPLLKE